MKDIKKLLTLTCPLGCPHLEPGVELCHHRDRKKAATCNMKLEESGPNFPDDCPLQDACEIEGLKIELAHNAFDCDALGRLVEMREAERDEALTRVRNLEDERDTFREIADRNCGGCKDRAERIELRAMVERAKGALERIRDVSCGPDQPSAAGNLEVVIAWANDALSALSRVRGSAPTPQPQEDGHGS